MRPARVAEMPTGSDSISSKFCWLFSLTTSSYLAEIPPTEGGKVTNVTITVKNLAINLSSLKLEIRYLIRSVNELIFVTRFLISPPPSSVGGRVCFDCHVPSSYLTPPKSKGKLNLEFANSCNNFTERNATPTL